MGRSECGEKWMNVDEKLMETRLKLCVCVCVCVCVEVCVCA